MSINLYSELRKFDNEDSKLKLLMRTIKDLSEEKKDRSFLEKLVNKKAEIQSKIWR